MFGDLKGMDEEGYVASEQINEDNISNVAVRILEKA